MIKGRTPVYRTNLTPASGTTEGSVPESRAGMLVGRTPVYRNQNQGPSGSATGSVPERKAGMLAGRTPVYRLRGGTRPRAYGHIWPEGYYPALPYGWNLETGEGTALPIPDGYVEAFVWAGGRGDWLVGHANDADGVTQAVAWNLGSGGTVTVLGSPAGDTNVQAFGVYGEWAMGGCSGGYVGWHLTDPSTPIVLPSVGTATAQSYSYSVNGSGLVPGWADDGTGAAGQFPFVWDLADAGSYIALGIPSGCDGAVVYNLTDRWAVGSAHLTGEPNYFDRYPVLWDLTSPDVPIVLGDGSGKGEAYWVEGDTVVGDLYPGYPEPDTWRTWDATDPTSSSIGANYLGNNLSMYLLDLPWYTGVKYDLATPGPSGQAVFSTADPSVNDYLVSGDSVSSSAPTCVTGSWIGGVSTTTGGVELPVVWDVQHPDVPTYLSLPDGYVYGNVYAVIVP